MEPRSQTEGRCGTAYLSYFSMEDVHVQHTDCSRRVLNFHFYWICFSWASFRSRSTSPRIRRWNFLTREPCLWMWVSRKRVSFKVGFQTHICPSSLAVAWGWRTNSWDVFLRRRGVEGPDLHSEQLLARDQAQVLPVPKTLLLCKRQEKSSYKRLP